VRSLSLIAVARARFWSRLGVWCSNGCSNPAGRCCTKGLTGGQCRDRFRRTGNLAPGASEDRIHAVGGLAQNLGDRRGVQVHGDLEATVAQQVLDGARMLTQREQARGVGMAKVVLAVLAAFWQARIGEHALESR
jgi:hypothetical protein